MGKTVCLVLAILLAATPVHAAEDPFCAALEDLRVEARQSHEPRRIAIIHVEPENMACRRDKTSVDDAFCSAAVDRLGLEALHAFPWLIRDCLSKADAHPYTQTVDQYTMFKNRPKITRLWAEWPDGGRLDIQFRPDRDFGDLPKYKDYWGSYEMTVWYP